MPRNNNEAQISLLPLGRVNTTQRDVPIDEIRYTLSSRPTPEFVDSVRAVGVLQPVLLKKIGNHYIVVAGRRRVYAAESAGMRSVPAVVITGQATSEVLASLTMAENHQRASNPIGDLEAINVMLTAGAGPREIAQAIGVTERLVRKRMRLSGLLEGWRARLSAGVVSIPLAERIAAWDEQDQQRFYEATVGSYRINPIDIRIFREQGERGASGPLSGFSTETQEMFPTATMGAATVVGQGMETNGGAFDIILWRNERWVPERVAGNNGAASTISLAQLSGWGGVLALLTQIDQIMPVEPNDDSDAFFAAMDEMRERVARRLA